MGKQFAVSVPSLPDMAGAKVHVPTSEDSCGVSVSTERSRSLTFFGRYDSCYAQTAVSGRRRRMMLL